MAKLNDYPRIYRELKYKVTTISRYTIQVPAVPSARSPEFPIIDDGRNVVGIRMIHAFTYAGVQAAVANSRVSDALTLIEFLNESGTTYQEYPNYGIMAADANGVSDTTKTYDRIARFMGDDNDAVADPAAGASPTTGTFDIDMPVTVPAGAKYTIRWTLGAVTTIYAAVATLATVTVTMEVLTTDDPVSLWQIKAKALALIIGSNPLSQVFKEGETIVGWLWQLITSTEADVTAIRLKKSGAVYIDSLPFSSITELTDTRYNQIVRGVGEALMWHDALVWDTKTTFEFQDASAGTLRVLSFHPMGSTDASPDARNANAGYKPPSATSPSGAQTVVAPAQSGGAGAIATASTPAAGAALQAGPGSFQRLKAASRLTR